jgi:hypothetical protein
MTENMKHLRKLAGFAVVMLVIYNLWIHNAPKNFHSSPDTYIAIYLAFAILFWPVYFLILSIQALYYLYKKNQPYALNVFLTMLLVVLFGCYSCYGVR